MFAAMVLLGAGYTLKVNEHVRVDLFYGWVSERTRTWIDLLGAMFCLVPMCVVLIYFTWPWFLELLEVERDLLQRRRPAALAGQARPAGRLRLLCCCRASPRSSSASPR